MHRLRSLRTGLPGVSDFCAGRSAREVEAVYGTERKLREGRQIHTRRIRQAPRQVVLGLFGLLKRISISTKSPAGHDHVWRAGWAPESRFRGGTVIKPTVLSLAMSCESPALPDPPTLAPGASRR